MFKFYISRILSLLLIVISISTTQALAGDKVTKKVQELIDSSQSSVTDSSKAFSYAQSAIDEAEKSKSNISIAAAMYNMARTFKYHDRYSYTIVYFDFAIEAYENAGEQLKVAEVLRQAGRIYYAMGHYDKAMTYYMNGLKIYDDLNVVNADKGWLLRYIGSVFKHKENYDKALYYYKKAYEIFENTNNQDGMSSSYNNIGIVYGIKGRDSLEIFYYRKALKVAQDGGAKNRESVILNNIGSALTKHHKYAEAMTYFEEVFDYLSELDEPNYMKLGDTYKNFAKLYYETDKLDLALENLKLSELNVRKTEKKQKIELAEIYELYSKLYVKKGDYKKAYEYRLLYNDLQKLLGDASVAAEIEKIQFRYEREQFEEKINQEREKENAASSSQRQWLIYLSIGIVLLTLALVVQKIKFSRALRNK